MQKVVWSMQKPDLQHHLSTRVKYVKRLPSSLIHLTGLQVCQRCLLEVRTSLQSSRL